MRNIINWAKRCIVGKAFGTYNKSKECKESKTGGIPLWKYPGYHQKAKSPYLLI